MILILSNKWDVTVDFVVRELRNRGAQFLRINTEDLVRDGIEVHLPEFRLVLGKTGQAIELQNQVKSIWYRRPGKAFDQLPQEQRPSSAIQQFVNDQWYSCLEALELLPGIRWINHPKHNDRMESKVRQLHLASQLGFVIPRTLISNSYTAITRFCNDEGNNIVGKSLYAPLIEEPEQDYFIFSNIVSNCDLNEQAGLQVAPTIFQQLISLKTDYRVTVVGGRVFPVRLTSKSESPLPLDWRTQGNVSYELCDLPESITTLCREYVKQNELYFGAIDLVEFDGEFYFLEINPNGEWGWLEKSAGVRITEAICDLLQNEDAAPTIR